jgi:hypothetical protein
MSYTDLDDYKIPGWLALIVVGAWLLLLDAVILYDTWDFWRYAE